MKVELSRWVPESQTTRVWVTMHHSLPMTQNVIVVVFARDQVEQTFVQVDGWIREADGRSWFILQGVYTSLRSLACVSPARTDQLPK